MNYSQVIKAYPAIAEIKRLRLPYDKARAVYEVAKSLESDYAFFAEEERKCIEKYAERDKSGKIKTTTDGRIVFENIHAQTAYTSEISKLLETNAETAENQIILRGADISEPISAETIAALDSIISFKD